MAFIGPIGDETIMAGTASRDIHEFTVDGEYTEWSSNSKIPHQWRQYRSKVTSISQFKDCSILICDNESFTVLDRKQKGGKLRKIKSSKFFILYQTMNFFKSSPNLVYYNNLIF